MKKLVVALSIGALLLSGCGTQSNERLASNIAQEIEASDVSEVHDYSYEVIEVLDGVKKGMEGVNKRLEAITNDPSIVKDPEFALYLTFDMLLIEGNIKKGNEINVPEHMEEVHAIFIKALEEYNFISDNLPRALGDRDIDLLNELSEKGETGKGYVIETTNLLQLIINEL